MSVFAGPEIINDGLIYSLDPASIRSYPLDNNIINLNSWRVGSGSITGFSQNGTTIENERIIGNDPFGNPAILWEARPQGDTSSDGGWNTSNFSVDNTKLYRLSTWVKRSVYVSGRFYLGTYGFGQVNGVLNRSNGNNNTNPYYWVTSDPPSFAQLPENTWVLVVGHNWPVGSGTGSNYVDSGVYTIADGRIGNISSDYVWREETTAARSRSYLFYSNSTEPRQQWCYPRVDIVDGSEPSINDLLSNKINSLYLFDLMQKLPTTIINGATYNSNNNGYFTFDGTDQYIDCGNNSILNVGNNITVNFWFNINRTNVFEVMIGKVETDYSAGWEIDNSSGVFRATFRPSSNIIDMYGGSLSIGKWYMGTMTYDGTTAKLFLDGIETTSTTSGGPVTLDSSVALNIARRLNGSNFQGNISKISIYNRALSSAEILQNFNATRGRFGI